MTQSNVDTQYLNFKHIKERTNVLSLLAFYGLHDKITAQPGKDEMVGRCPFGEPGHGDETSFAFNTKKKTFQCFACKTRGSVLDFYRHMEQAQGNDISLREAGLALDRLNEQVKGSEQFNKELIQSYQEKAAVTNPKFSYLVEPKQPEKAADCQNVKPQFDQGQLDQQAIDAGREALQRKLLRMSETTMLTDPNSAMEIAELKIGSLTHETMGMILTNAKHGFINYVELGKGSTDSVKISINYLMRSVIEQGASAVILCHNHPSGTPEPSDSDKAFTENTKAALALIDVTLLDHIIVASPTISMAEQGLI